MSPQFAAIIESIRMYFDILLLVITIVFFYQKRALRYWNRRRVLQLRPRFPFGDFADTFLQRKSYAVRLAELYNEAVSEGQQYIGIYVLLQPILLVTNVELAKRILTVDFEHFTDRGAYIDEKRDPLSGHLFSLAGAKWRRMRRKLSPAFTAAKLKGMFPTMMACGRTLSAVVDENLGQALDIRDLMTRFTMDVIASVGFGLECSSMRNPDEEFRQMGARFFAKRWQSSLRMLMAFVAPNVNWYLKLKLNDNDVEEYMLNLMRETIAKREDGGEVRRDFVQLLVQLRNQVELTDDGSWEMNRANAQGDQNKALSVEEMAAQAFMFIQAGYETTSSTVTFCLFELCRNRNIMSRVQEEIDRVLDGGREISYDAIAEMHYLESCVHETLRLYPVLPFLFRVCTEPYRIPQTTIVVEKDTLVQIPLLGIQRDPKEYENPLRFDPERYGERRAETMAHLSFGDGPRGCIGQRMGKVMTKMALAELLSRHDFELISPATDGDLELDPSLLMLQAKQEIKLIPRLRVR